MVDDLEGKGGERVRIRTYDWMAKEGFSTLTLSEEVGSAMHRASTDLEPSELRALAALLLKHADRAEGTSATQEPKKKTCEGYESAWDRAAIECRHCGRKKEEHWGDVEGRERR